MNPAAPVTRTVLPIAEHSLRDHSPAGPPARSSTPSYGFPPLRQRETPTVPGREVGFRADSLPESPEVAKGQSLPGRSCLTREDHGSSRRTSNGPPRDG